MVASACCLVRGVLLDAWTRHQICLLEFEGRFAGFNWLSEHGSLSVWFMDMQSLADKKKNVTDEDVLALVSDEVHQPEKLWDLLGLQVMPFPDYHSV